jgi:hypothetical protein
MFCVLLEREGPDFTWNDMSVKTRLEGLCEESCRIRYWAAMRWVGGWSRISNTFCSGLAEIGKNL